MKKLATCSLPSYPHRVLKSSDKLQKGDLFNYHYPVLHEFDEWWPITHPNGTVKDMGKGWVVIRPL